MKKTINNAPRCLNLNDKAFWVTGWNEAVDEFCKEKAEQKITCTHCDGTGKVTCYGIEESWKENCVHCVAAEVDNLLALRVRLKSGCYDGADIMRAWIAVKKLADMLASEACLKECNERESVAYVRADGSIIKRVLALRPGTELFTK